MSCIRALRSLVAAACLAAGGMAYAAAGLSPDPTGLWYDPAESGWGVTLVQQGDTVFAVLFLYDDAKNPAWYVASAVRDLHRETFAPAPPTFGGTLYRTSGPWFGGPFDPTAVTNTPVGDLELQYASDDGKSLRLDYSIDGVHVSKTVEPQTWGSAVETVREPNTFVGVGTYAGGAIITSTTPAGCTPTDFTSFVRNSFPFNISVIVSEASHVTIGWGGLVDVVCQFDGAYTQLGQRGAIDGHFGCGPLGSTFDDGTPFHITDFRIGPHGFSGRLTFEAPGCTQTGHIGGVRNGP